MVNYINKLKEKCHLSNEFIQIIHQIFDKLLEFGYITKRQEKKLQKKLYDHIDVVILGKKDSLDYKSGYYDAVKKELYIKDISNIESVYQRIIYILTTTATSNDSFCVGYSNANLSKSSYKIVHENFGINRAVVSNLVCRLLYTIPTTLSIVPTYRTYENDFLGNQIVSDNDIYFLEGKLLSQLCYVLQFNEENLYVNLFNHPERYLNKMLYKSVIENPQELLEKFDIISRNYSHYNKLIYFNKLLNDNYLAIKKNILNQTVVEKLTKQQNKIHFLIRNALIPLVNLEATNEEFNTNVESYLSEQITTLEDTILANIASLQEIFVQIVISMKHQYSDVEYAIKLKELDKLLVVSNECLNNELYETISFDLLKNPENTTSNLIEKMKYSLANEILTNQKYLRVYKNLMFHQLEDIAIPRSSALIAITLDNAFMQLVEIDTLNFATKNLKNNTHTIHLNNMHYLLNNNTIKLKVNKIETIFSDLKNQFPQFQNISIQNVYLCDVDNCKLAIVIHDDSFSIISITKDEEQQLQYHLVKLSEAYSIFGINRDHLPVIYNKNKNSIFQKILAIFYE